jgi:hypothetical protein
LSLRFGQRSFGRERLVDTNLSNAAIHWLTGIG